MMAEIAIGKLQEIRRSTRKVRLAGISKFMIKAMTSAIGMTNRVDPTTQTKVRNRMTKYCGSSSFM
jgi:hypothetical protein